MSDRLPELFARALELDDAARAAFVADLAASDPVAAGELRLLLAGTGPASPLDRSPWSEEARFDAADVAVVSLPERIGPYRIVSELGRGGMGRVFLAEEETADFRRSVALKVIDRPAFDDDAVRRFRDELRILSALDHPGIARFLHGGRSDEGVWFLALELVRGENLLAWAEHRGLDLRQRVELFARALEPVRFAHERGIVHRDLKPSHLLVDDDGRVRLLDFGISKLVDPSTRSSVAVTRTLSRALTPAYASPEQFRDEPVTLASDVFSLGVLLYELIAGARPFAAGELSSTAFERAVLEADPLPPSAAARRAALSRPSETESTTRARTAGRSELSRDLDAICMKALRKPPGERYADAGALADDLAACLAGLPVEARRGGRRYRLFRLVRRHRVRLGVAVTLAIAVAAVLFGLRAERRAAGARPPAPAAVPASFARLAPAAELERELARSPLDREVGARLVAALSREGRAAEAEVALSRLRQIPGADDDPLVDYAECILAIGRGEAQRALALATRGLGRAAATGRGDLVPTLRMVRGRALSDLGRPEEAGEEVRGARREAELAGDDFTLAAALNDLAVAKLMQGELRAGEKLLDQALLAARRSGDASRSGFIENNLGGIEMNRGRPDIAVGHFERAVSLVRPSGRQRVLANYEFTLAEALEDLGRGAEAIALLDGALGRLREIGDSAFLGHAIFLRFRAALSRGELDRAGALAAELAAAARTAGQPEGLAMAEEAAGRLALLRGDRDEATQRLESAARIHLQDGDPLAAHEASYTLVELELEAGRVGAAARRLEEALGTMPASSAEEHPAWFGALLGARIELAEGRPEAALARLESLGVDGGMPSLERRLAGLETLAEVERTLGRDDEARRDFERAARAAESAGYSPLARKLRAELGRVNAGGTRSPA